MQPGGGASRSIAPTAGDLAGPTHHLDTTSPNVGYDDVGTAAIATYSDIVTTGDPRHSHCYYSSQPLIFLGEDLFPYGVLIGYSLLYPTKRLSDPLGEVLPSSDHSSVAVSHIAPNQSLVRGVMTKKRAKMGEASPIFTKSSSKSFEKGSIDEAI